MDRRTLTRTAIRRVVQLPPAPELPSGYTVELPGRGTTFVAEIEGPPGAPTLFLLHGLACTAYLNWFPALESLSAKYHIIMMDMRGHGRGIRHGRFFRLKDCADDAVAVADLFGIESFIPVGYSMGGPVAQLLWRHHPERVDGLVLCATARNFRGKPQERLFFMMLPAVAMGLALRKPGTETADAMAKRLIDFPADAELSDLDVPSWALKEFRRTSPWTMLQGVNAIGQYSSHGWITDIDVPTAVVVTTKDRFIPTSRQLRLAELIPGATTHLCNANHAACVLAAHRFVPVLNEAVDSVTSRL
ncbi:MAG TPA: alpha/beta hydrolase [Acidimicrobiales bacterium]|nr:alpha/beta hydrolase [Acidimicrobiales bacterium]